MAQIPAFLLGLTRRQGEHQVPGFRFPRSHVQITDYRGTLVMSLQRDCIVLAKALDNYVCLWYKDGSSDFKSIVFRQKMQELAKVICSDDIVRCHRSYIVNLEYVKIIRPYRKSYRMDIGLPGVDYVPVSAAFISKFAENGK